jgi:hypothetical protein
MESKQTQGQIQKVGSIQKIGSGYLCYFSNISTCTFESGGKGGNVKMKIEKTDGYKTIDGVKVPYEVELHIPETLEEYETFTVKDGRGEDARKSTMIAIVDYERRYQRDNARPATSAATGIRELTKAVSTAVKAGDITMAQAKDALAELGIKVA